MGVKEELEHLYQLKEHKMKLGLQPTFDALEKLGNPHKKLRFIHVTGTNGKGSTCAFIADTLQLAGFKVGLFTSPHLVTFNERIQIDRKNISDEELSELIKTVRETGVQLTFFEYATVMGILYYSKHNVDFVVWEVGLGGMLDSTNVVDAEIAVLTNIGLDHTHILGDTVEKIARDKCGIIKKNSKVVTCADNAGLQWIKEKCQQQGNQLFIATPYEGRILLLGEFQKKNAGIARQVCELLGVKEEIIKKGLASAKWAGRLEWMEKNILVDCGHNPAAIQATAPFVNSLPKKRLILVFGVLKDKDYASMIKALPKADVIVLTKPKSERAIEPKELPFKDAIIKEEPIEAYKYAKSIARAGDIIFVVGSCYLVGNIKEKLVR